MDSKIVKIAGTENRAKIIRYFSLVNYDKKYICFINYNGKGLDLSTIHLGYVSEIGDKIIVFKIELDDEWLKIKPIMENLFATGTSNEIVTYPVDNIERIDVVSYHTFDKKITDFSKFFNIKTPQEIDFSIELPHHHQAPTPVEVISNTSVINGPFETTTPVSSRKKGSKMVIILAIIVLILAIAAALYYFKDEIFKGTEPANNNAVNETTKYADNELVCTIKYNDNESSGVISDKMSYIFSDDKTKFVSAKTESKIKFTNEEDYTISKQNTEMALGFASMFGIVMNIDSDDDNLTYTVSTEMNVEQAKELDFESGKTGSYNDAKEQALAVGYNCNGTEKEYKKAIGNGKIVTVDEPIIIINDGWRIVANAKSLDEDSTAMEFTINIRHLNDSSRDLTGVLTTYDENKNPLSTTTISSEDVKANTFFNIDLDTEFNTEELVENFDFKNIQYFSIEINK